MKTYRLRLTRVLDAPREKVFRAWASPEGLRRFLRPCEDWTSPGLRADVRVGGRYRFPMRDPEGKLSVAAGVYREVEPFERISFTWTWEPGHAAAGVETLVVVRFRDKGKRTELILTHDLLPSAAERSGHREGWTGCLRIFRGFIEGHARGS